LKPAKKQPLRLKNDRWLFFAVGAALLLIAGLAVWFNVTEESQGKELAANSDLRLPLADLDSGDREYFTYPVDSTTTVRFLAQRDSDKTLHVSFAMCRTCYGYHRNTYEMWGRVMCGHCNREMAIPNAGEEPAEKSNCALVGIPFTVENDQLIVRGQAIVDQFQRWYRPSRVQKQR
jgi:uncharacterized membrane protein